MKKLLLIASFLLFVFTVNAQESKVAENPEPVKTKTAPVLKKHSCSADCKAEEHAYVHGEKGHSCSASCHTAKSKSHQCSADCKDGKHAYAHGEKGHSCDEGGCKAKKGKSSSHHCKPGCESGKHAAAHGKKGHK